MDDKTTGQEIAVWKAAIGQQLALERKAKGYNQTKAGGEMGWSQKTVSEIENGENSVLDNYIHYSMWADLDFAVLVARARAVIRSRQQAEVELHKLIG